MLKTKRIPKQTEISKLIIFNNKKNETPELTSLRPIMVTSILTKILEDIILKKLKEHTEEHNILTPNQRGFRNSASTATNLIDLYTTLEAEKLKKRNINKKVKNAPNIKDKTKPRNPIKTKKTDKLYILFIVFFYK